MTHGLHSKQGEKTKCTVNVKLVKVACDVINVRTLSSVEKHHRRQSFSGTLAPGALYLRRVWVR